MPTFNCFATSNSYLTPYSSAKDGGELVSEFNLRAPMLTPWSRCNYPLHHMMGMLLIASLTPFR